MSNILFALSDYFMEADTVLKRIEHESELLGELCTNRVAGIAYLNLNVT